MKASDALRRAVPLLQEAGIAASPQLVLLDREGEQAPDVVREEERDDDPEALEPLVPAERAQADGRRPRSDQRERERSEGTRHRGVVEKRVGDRHRRQGI